MKKLCVFLLVCTCSISFSMLRSNNISARNGCISRIMNVTYNVLGQANDFFKKPAAFSLLDLGGSLVVTGITFYQLANVRDKQVQIVRAIDERMDRFPKVFLFERSNDELWKVREAVKEATDTLNDSFKRAMMVGAISESAIKFAGLFYKSDQNGNGKSNEQKQDNQSGSSDDNKQRSKTITGGFPLTLSAMGAMAFYLDKIFEVNHATKKAKRLLNTPKYKGEKKIK